MKYLTMVFLSIIVLSFAACSSTDGEIPTEVPGATESPATLATAVPITEIQEPTAEPTQESYPVDEQTVPPAEGYPAEEPTVAVGEESSLTDTIIVGHQHTDVSQIPDYWIDQARQYVIHYAHTSHGNQVLSGLTWLENQDPRFNVDIQASESVVLPSDTTALHIYDGNNYPGDTYISSNMYWEGADGLAHTRSVVDTGGFDFSLWTWCGEMSYYSDAQIQEYLDVMSQLDGEYVNTQFILYTGHTDGSAPDSDLWRHNDMARQYAQDNNMILFDFADIESYNPDGTFYSTTSDVCEWCDDWCNAHPTNFECQNLPGCDHSHGLQCTLKGQAFWWMMARLAGWDGTPTP